MKRIDESELVGKRYGHLVVISDSSKRATNGHRRVVCRCDCGNVKEISISHLKTGASRSCGCGVRKATIRRCTTHGDTGTRLHNIWLGMRRRCYNKNEAAYPRYGGRGITICSEWNDYSCFKEWSLTHGYRDDLSIDRIDVNGNYSPSNCRWATIREQARNKRDNRVVEINGQKKLITEWLKESPVSASAVYDRLRKGWDIETALFTKNIRTIKKGCRL